MQWHLVQTLGELVGTAHAPHERRVVGIGIGQQEGPTRVLHVGAPVWLVEIAQRLPGLGALDGDHAPRLAVAAARGEARAVQHSAQDLSGYGIALKAPGSRRTAHDLVQVHGPHTSRSASSEAAMRRAVTASKRPQVYLARSRPARPGNLRSPWSPVRYSAVGSAHAPPLARYQRIQGIHQNCRYLACVRIRSRAPAVPARAA